MKQLLIITLAILSITIQSCSSCKYAPTYGGRGAMLYGHSDETQMKGTKNPYKVKAKKTKKSKNRYSTKGWRSW